MYTAKISLTAQDDTSNENELCTCASYQLSSLIAVLRKNGQVIGREYPFIEEENSISAFVNIADKDSLHEKYHNIYVQRDIQNIGLNRLTIEILGKDPESNGACQCSFYEEMQYLILYTDHVAHSSPIDCGSCELYIPLYKLPKIFDSDEYLNIVTWEKSYQSYDYLQMQGFNEKFALEQMYSLTSELTQYGREITKDMSKQTGIPCYYYLYVHYGDSIELEEQRKCPCCGDEWLLNEQIRHFDFKCDSCHLLSNIALSFDGDE